MFPEEEERKDEFNLQFNNQNQLYQHSRENSLMVNTDMNIDDTHEVLITNYNSDQKEI